MRLLHRTHGGVPFALMCLGGAALVSSHASAEWPPPESATAVDMADPANWPNDEGYGFSQADGDAGQWNFYSFVPEPNEARHEETASGMSIDLAWRLTTGDPSVIIAITDSGIEWDRRDIHEAAYLNHRELGAHRPALQDGTSCGDLDPDFHLHPDDTSEALSAFDCNGDGILTVADYALSPTLLPEEGENQKKGDMNHNGVLDAGDIILNYSDGFDDDANGYVDDISGWDFFKNDNDPYDDTRHGHGSGQATDSLSRANNEVGEAGACPNCRMLQLRVGDSVVADANDFAQAVVYATDMRASVVQSALATMNMTRFAQSALDYAYESGVLTVASMGDENSRHHNMPSASNHTLPVHAIQFGGDTLFTSDSFVRFHPCSNFGGQNMLSASGTGCSSEAVGRLAGITGLLYSAARKYNVELTPGEAQSILFMTADDIDIAESRVPEPSFKWSQAGFDQRFGYGRVNANTAVEWVRDGRIPPAVDVTSPTWFSVLYQDQAEAPIDIEGTVSAKRANSYDYSVEWAPGVQPFDEDFKVFHSEENVPPDVVVGTATPLASLDIRDIDPTHEPDSDSPHGENRNTITVRVRAVAHYGGEVGDVPGEMRRTYYVHQDPDLAKGFPVFLGDSGESSPKMADIDGDGVRELLYATSGGELHVLRLTPDGPEPLPGFPFLANRVDGMRSPPPSDSVPIYLDAPGYASGAVEPDEAREALTASAPAIADLDGDGSVEIVVTSFAGTVYVVQNDGQIRDGWPLRLPEVPSCSLDADNPSTGTCMSVATQYARGAFAAPVLADMDQDGALDIIQAAFDGKVYVFDADAKPVDGFPVRVHYEGKLAGEPNTNRVFTTPAVADFNGDGFPELLVGSNEQIGEGDSGAIYLIDGRAAAADEPYLPNWPVTMASLRLSPMVGEGIPNSGVIGRFQGTLATVMHGNASTPLLLPADPGPQRSTDGKDELDFVPTNAMPRRPDSSNPGEIARGLDPSSVFGPLSDATQPNTMLPLFSQPALGDMDQDGVPDVVSAGGSLALALNIQADTGAKGDHLLAMWSGATGAMLPAAPIVIEDFSFMSSSAIADLTGDGYPEAIFGTGGYYVHAVDACGREPDGWPKFTGQWVASTPAVGDLDGDGTLEVAVGTRSGWLYVWHSGASTQNVVEWESFHHDNRNTGNLESPLEQGGQGRASTPLVAAMCIPPAEDQIVPYEISGGCGCRTHGHDGAPSRGAWTLLGLAGLAAAVRRRRTLRGGSSLHGVNR